MTNVYQLSRKGLAEVQAGHQQLLAHNKDIWESIRRPEATAAVAEQVRKPPPDPAAALEAISRTTVFKAKDEDWVIIIW